METLIQSIFYITILIFSVVIHEVSHGYAALYLGDRTAQYAGRLTLNPLPHLDLFGSIILPALLVFVHSPIIIGWAKPVPYNPYNLRDQKWGPAMVGAAGPFANIALALVFGILIRFVPFFSSLVSGTAVLNFLTIASGIVLINLMLAVFNLIPIPPLDGSKVLFSLLPYRWQEVRVFLERYGFLLLLIFIFFFGGILFPIVLFLFRIIAGTFPFL